MILFKTKTTTQQETLIPGGAGIGQIKIFTIKILGETNTENTITISNNNDVIDKFILTSKGQIEGMKGETRPIYAINGNFNISCTSTAQISIFLDYEVI